MAALVGGVAQPLVRLVVRPDRAGAPWTEGTALETWLGLEAAAAVLIGLLAPDRPALVATVAAGWSLQVLHFAVVGGHYDDSSWSVGDGAPGGVRGGGRRAGAARRAGDRPGPSARRHRRVTDSLLVADAYDCSDPDARAAGLDAAAAAIARGELVLMPTDTVYGVAADAFTPAAVTGLLAAKNRGRTMPVPVLIGEASTLAGLVVDLPPVAHRLAEAFWPGGLTLVLEHAPSLAWDLGDAEGTVAVRLPDDDVARDLLRRTGPLAVSSANRSGRPAASTAQEAVEQLGSRAAVVLDGGPRAGSAASTIVDCTGPTPRVLRVGAIGVDRLREVVPELTD